MLRLIRRLFVGFFLANLLFALGTAAVAAVMRRRLESEPPPEPGDNDLEVSAIFDGKEFRSEARSLRSVRAMSWFGGLELDLRGARIDPRGAELRLGSLYGGLDVVIPDDWQVTIRKVGIFGGVDAPDVSIEAPAQPGPAVEISAVAAFGGVSIHREPASPPVLEPAAG